jgi:four helix bundle protein
MEENGMAKGDDIQERLIDFAVRIMKLCSALPKTQAGKHVAGQLLRCGTSPAPNYGEARGAESNRDFVHKLGIVLKELNESGIWLEMIVRSEMLPERQVRPLDGECEELRKIVASSIRTAGKHTRRSR